MSGRGYAAGKYVASFVGFAPVKEPALVAVVILDEPWPRYHGGEVAAPVFARIAGQTLLYLGVPPDREDVPWLASMGDASPGDASPGDASPGVRATALAAERQPNPAGTGRSDAVPDFAGLTARQAVSLSADLGFRLALSGHGAVARQSPPPGTPLEAASTIEVWLATPEVM